MTVPLLEGTDGVQKMSKSLENYIGINEAPNEQFGKVMSISDEMMFRYYELVTDVPMSEIAALKADVASGKRHPMEAKKDLAVHIIANYHGAEAAAAARNEFERVFSRREIPEDIETKELPTGAPIRLTKLLASLNLAPSVTEAQRLIESGAVHINDERITNVKSELDLGKSGEYLFKVGKRRFMRVVVKG
jgi:tyrosyl-tRNA synthetase